MTLGTGLKPVKDYLHLSKNQTYRCILNDPASNLAVLAWHPSQNQKVTCLTVLSSTTFEAGLTRGILVSDNNAGTLPPWLRQHEDKNLTHVQAERSVKGRKRNVAIVCNEKFDLCKTVIGSDKETIIVSENPKAEIRKRVRALQKNPITEQAKELSARLGRENPTRLMEAVLLVIVYDVAQALHPATLSNGSWDRTKKLSKPEEIPLGARWRLPPDIKKSCVRAFEKHAALGMTLKEVFIASISDPEFFRCRIEEVGKGYHRKLNVVPSVGVKIPSLYQYRYALHAEFGIQAVHIKLYGKSRYRNNSKTSIGRTTEELCRFLEKVEIDAYFVNKRPASKEGAVVPDCGPCIIRIVDILSGAVVGIGASERGENVQALLDAIYSMVIGLDKIARRYGIDDYGPDDVPPPGINSWLIFDRGAASTWEEAVKHFGIKVLTPKGQGQSKPTVESTHPRDRDINEAHLIIQSGFTAVELIREAIIDAIKVNKTKNVTYRLPDEMLDEGVLGNPLSMCRWLTDRRRTCARQMNHHAAVREFLEKFEFSVQADGVYLHGQRFDSEELRKSGVLEMPGQKRRVYGYLVGMATRNVWIDFKGRLWEAYYTTPTFERSDEKGASVSILAARNELRRATAREQNNQAIAAELEGQQALENVTGHLRDPIQRVPRHRKSTKKAA